jgi:hypothetical protein
MGGFGSGKWMDVYRRKISVEQCMSISVKFLRVNGLLEAGRAGEIFWTDPSNKETGRAVIEVVSSGDGDITSLRLKTGGIVTGQEYFIELERMACRFGGVRYWFLCPAVKDDVYCGNRVTKLFLPSGGSVFGCRDCYDLTYQSCQESHKYDKVFGHIEGADIGSLSVTQALRLGGL